MVRKLGSSRKNYKAAATGTPITAATQSINSDPDAANTEQDYLHLGVNYYVSLSATGTEIKTTWSKRRSIETWQTSFRPLQNSTVQTPKNIRSIVAIHLLTLVQVFCSRLDR